MAIPCPSFPLICSGCLPRWSAWAGSAFGLISRAFPRRSSFRSVTRASPKASPIMSDSSASHLPRPVSVITVLAIFVTFALFLLVARHFYLPRQTGAFTDDGIHTRQYREDRLSELRKKQSEQATHY